MLAAEFAQRPSFCAEQYGFALSALSRCQLAREGKAGAAETLKHAIELLAPYFLQRPQALTEVMERLVREVESIDTAAAQSMVPDEIRSMLDHLRRRRDAST